MSKVVIYKNDDGGVAVIHPASDVMDFFGIDAIAQKDVPAGKPYAIINASALPADKLFRAAWEIDPTLLTDGTGADYGEGSLWQVIGITDTTLLLRHIETKEENEVPR